MSTTSELAENRFLERVAAHVRSALESMAADYGERGRSLRELGSVEEIAERMPATTVPSPSLWDEALAPFCSTSKGAERLATRRERRDRFPETSPAPRRPVTWQGETWGHCEIIGPGIYGGIAPREDHFSGAATA
jgi:hypothetical protein